MPWRLVMLGDQQLNTDYESYTNFLQKFLLAINYFMNIFVSYNII